ncbi:Early nodulin-like protein [Quillaja saponaria]|uniref:Early nodulin-like protein n=1 Tax=Quillaja saponaria TaxID=32244 RepID=A0AAD7M0N5_QUISA|nr:Early nodulin-like protein [Quillaja saponaria]
MAGFNKMMILALVIISASSDAKWVTAQVHHVVGGDRGWDQSSDLDSWSSGRVFTVGDKIWFTYSAAQEKIAEVKSKEEYESCDMSNPIKMYTDGLDSIPLVGEGIRYFLSGELEHCKSGLKLHVEVQPKPKPNAPKVQELVGSKSVVAADGPSSPSGSAHHGGNTVLILLGFLYFILHLAY